MISFSLWVWNSKFPHVSIFSSHTILLLGNAGPRFMTFVALLYFLSFFFFPAGEFSVRKINENLSIIISDISFVPAGIYLQRDCHWSTWSFVKNFKENSHLQQPNWSSYISQLCLTLHLCSWGILRLCTPLLLLLLALFELESSTGRSSAGMCYWHSCFGRMCSHLAVF